LCGKYNVKNFVFSSSATVYGPPKSLPIKESDQVGCGITNPYGQTKYMIERILMDIANADKSWNIILLRYFNPVGAHPSGLIGEDPKGIPNNLMPYPGGYWKTASAVHIWQQIRHSRWQVVAFHYHLAQASQKRTSDLTDVAANLFDTLCVSGTGMRDYIHVVDLARGHVAAFDRLKKHKNIGCEVYNLGTGKAYSVLEMVAALEKASGRKVCLTVHRLRHSLKLLPL
uniref:UDP-glucose 4-epimerase n=1 Tax=Gongylonema pulchrum TaxID=637853 RepID=A0A183DI33_9BILA